MQRSNNLDAMLLSAEFKMSTAEAQKLLDAHGMDKVGKIVLYVRRLRENGGDVRNPGAVLRQLLEAGKTAWPEQDRPLLPAELAFHQRNVAGFPQEEDIPACSVCGGRGFHYVYLGTTAHERAARQGLVVENALGGLRFQDARGARVVVACQGCVE